MLRGVGKRYRRTWVLRDVDLEVAAGELVSVTGANGSGKSSLLRLCAGVTRPSAGVREPLPAPVRWVPDRVTVAPRLRATEYLQLQGAMQGTGPRVVRDRARDLLDRLGLVGGHDAPLGTLSKGNVQKVVLAQAVLTRPRLLVLDEPWTALDSAAHDVLTDLLAELADDGTAVLIAGHGAGPATASRRLVMRSGRPVPAEPAAVIVELLDAGDSGTRHAGRGPGWAGHPGVLAVRGENGGVRLDVRPTEVDNVLRAALAGAWSVTRVERPADGSDRR